MTEQRELTDGIVGGRVRRAAPVAGLVARTAGESVVAALRRRGTGVEDPERHVRSAERYAELLGRSRGALMKAGQAMSFVRWGLRWRPSCSPPTGLLWGGCARTRLRWHRSSLA